MNRCQQLCVVAKERMPHAGGDEPQMPSASGFSYRMPHAGGDEPREYRIAFILDGVCPTQVGMNRMAGQWGNYAGVCPTQVGMNRRGKAIGGLINGMPHAGGDEPLEYLSMRLLISYAPRRWG